MSTDGLDPQFGDLEGLDQRSILVRLGALIANERATRAQLAQVRAELNRMWKKLDEISRGLDKAPRVSTTALKPLKPWEKPLGEFFFDIFVAAVKMVGIGIVTGVIILGAQNIII